MQLTTAIRSLTAILLAFTVNTAYAAIGGLSKATSVAEDIETGAYTLLGAGAVIYLIYLAFMAFTEKKTWSDFGWGVLHVAIAGGVVALASWAWSLFA